MFSFFEKDESVQGIAFRQLKALPTAISDVKTHENAPDKAIFLETLQNLQKRFKKDLQDIEKELEFVILSDKSTENNTDLLRRWQTQGNAPSLAAICVAALGHINAEITPEDLNMVLIGAVLGEIPNDQPYHNNLHYKKVLLQTIRMIAAHNDIYGGTDEALNAAQIAKLLTAVCIHDLCHDGRGNVIKGVHTVGRLERLSFDIAEPYLKAVGCTDQKTLDDLLVMLLGTDVTPIGDPANPTAQIKAAFRFHYLDEKTKIHALNLSDELKSLEKDAELSLLCLILHEADIATSAGLNYEITKYETSLLHEEFRAREGKPSDVINFLDKICGRKFLSDAGQKLYASNMARIYKLVEQDLNNGDQSYPKSEHADFILHHQTGSTPKTIN